MKCKYNIHTGRWDDETESTLHFVAKNAISLILSISLIYVVMAGQHLKSSNHITHQTEAGLYYIYTSSTSKYQNQTILQLEIPWSSPPHPQNT